MTIRDIASMNGICICSEFDLDRTVESVFCCDLLSVAMARATENSAWITVMGNANVVAVATLADVSCIVIAEGYDFDEAAIQAAKGKIALLKSTLPVYETAMQTGNAI